MFKAIIILSILALVAVKSNAYILSNTRNLRFSQLRCQSSNDRDRINLPAMMNDKKIIENDSIKKFSIKDMIVNSAKRSVGLFLTLVTFVLFSPSISIARGQTRKGEVLTVKDTRNKGNIKLSTNVKKNNVKTVTNTKGKNTAPESNTKQNRRSRNQAPVVVYVEEDNSMDANTKLTYIGVGLAAIAIIKALLSDAPSSSSPSTRPQKINRVVPKGISPTHYNHISIRPYLLLYMS